MLKVEPCTVCHTALSQNFSAWYVTTISYNCGAKQVTHSKKWSKAGHVFAPIYLYWPQSRMVAQVIVIWRPYNCLILIMYCLVVMKLWTRSVKEMVYILCMKERKNVLTFCEQDEICKIVHSSPPIWQLKFNLCMRIPFLEKNASWLKLSGSLVIKKYII